MYYNMPLFSFNVKIWRYISFIEFKDYKKTGPLLTFQILYVSSIFLNIFKDLHDLGALSLDLFMFAINLNAIVRILIVMKHQWKFIDFMRSIDVWYKELELESDEVAWKVFRHLPRHNSNITKFGISFGSIGGIATVFLPLLYEERRHPYSVYIPGFDHLKSPGYEIIYAFQIFVGMPFIIVTYIPFTNLFISWLTFGISLIQILRYKLENLQHHRDQEMLRRLKKLIRFHQKIISYAKTLEDLVSFVCFIELLLYTMMIVVLLACFLLMENILFKTTTAFYTLCILYALFICYWHTNEFSSESEKIANAAYNTNWAQSSPAVRKCLLIMMIRSRVPLKIRAGGVVPMTLETFQAVLNGAYSYFTMLKGMMTQ